MAAPWRHGHQHPLQEVPKRKLYGGRISQEMDPASANERTRLIVTNSINPATAQGRHDDPGAQDPFGGARPERIAGPPEGKVSRERAHEEADWENHEHGVDRMAEDRSGARHPDVFGTVHLKSSCRQAYRGYRQMGYIGRLGNYVDPAHNGSSPARDARATSASEA